MAASVWNDSSRRRRRVQLKVEIIVVVVVIIIFVVVVAAAEFVVQKLDLSTVLVYAYLLYIFMSFQKNKKLAMFLGLIKTISDWINDTMSSCDLGISLVRL